MKHTQKVAMFFYLVGCMQIPAIILNEIEIGKFIDQKRTIYRSVSLISTLSCIEYLDIMSVFINNIFFLFIDYSDLSSNF